MTVESFKYYKNIIILSRWLKMIFVPKERAQAAIKELLDDIKKRDREKSPERIKKAVDWYWNEYKGK